MRLSISTNFPQVQQELQRVQRSVAQVAVARALNRTVEQARTAMSREIRQEFNLSAAAVRERLRIKRAAITGGLVQLQAELSADGKRATNLINFSARKVADGVSVKVKKAGGRKVLPGRFIGNKGRTVFERVEGKGMASRNRYKGTKHAQAIRPVQTIDVPQMFNARRINAAVVAAIEARFPAIFQRELAFALRQAAARA